jgi:hypothetical protein
MKIRDKYRSHSKQRFLERYGKQLSDEQYYALTDLIIQNKSLCRKKQTDSRTIHLLKIGKLYVVAVYSKSTKSIVTFLPQDTIGRLLLLKATEKR